MKHTKPFSFDFPVTEFSVNPPAFVGNLQVNCVAYTDGKFLLHENSFDVDDILWQGNSVFYLLQAMCPDGFDEIKEAAKNNARQYEGQEGRAEVDERELDRKAITGSY